MKELVKKMMLDATEDEVELFLAVCERTGLDPLARQIVPLPRWTGDRQAWQAFVTVDGLRVLAERTGKYAGQRGPFWCGPDGEWREVWLSSEPPCAAKVAVLREDFKEPLWGVARWETYAPVSKSGKLSPSWERMPDLMLAKCAEALALRRAFPAQMSGLYTTEEVAAITSDTAPEVPSKSPSPHLFKTEDPAPQGPIEPRKPVAPAALKRMVASKVSRLLTTDLLSREQQQPLTERALRPVLGEDLDGLDELCQALFKQRFDLLSSAELKALESWAKDVPAAQKEAYDLLEEVKNDYR